MKRLLIPIVVALMGAVTLLAQNTPLTPLARLMVRTDGSGNLMVTANMTSGSPTPLRPLANTPGTTDANGNLNVTLAGGTGTFADGSQGSPSITFASHTNTGMFLDAVPRLAFTVGGSEFLAINSAGVLQFTNDAGAIALGGAQDVTVGRPAATLVGVTAGAAKVTAGTDVAVTDTGDFARQRYQATITPSNGTDCAASFKAAALTADCNVATLPAGMKLVAVYADVTAGFTCSATCTGTKVLQCGTAAGGTQVLAASLNVATTATYGLVDADLGSSMVRAAAIQGGLIGSWSTTTGISCRFTSGTGNWGTGSVTNVNAGSVKFTLVTEQVK